MKPATGYLTDDGTFFETEAEAKQYETREELSAALTSEGINPQAILPFIDANLSTFNAYICARLDHPDAKSQPLPAQPQPPDSNLSMPHIRLRSQSETVSDDAAGTTS